MKFSDIATIKPLDGDKVVMDDVLNKQIIITGFKLNKSQHYKDSTYTIIQFHYFDDTENKVVFTSSELINFQLEECKSIFAKNSLPFEVETIIKKIGRAYSLT